jgi:flagellar FliL protein
MSSKPKAEKADMGEVGGKKPGGKKRLLMILLPLLLIGAGAGGWFSGVIPRLLGKGDAAEHAEGHAEEPAKESGKEAGKEHGKEAGKEASKEHGAEHGAAHGEKKEAAVKGGPVFMDLPDIVANLNTGGRRASFVKLKTKLELSKPEDQATLTAAMPRVLDLFQGYLREMRPEELRGSAATYRLREELLARTNLAAPPVRVTAVLFTEMIVQ